MTLIRELGMILVLVCAMSVGAVETIHRANACFLHIQGVIHMVFRESEEPSDHSN